MNNSKSVRSLARGLEVIEVLNSRQTTSMCVLTEQTNMPRATLLRILKTLEGAGWVYRHRISGGYRLASKVCLLGERLLTSDRLAEVAGPIMHKLTTEFRCASDLAICTGHDMRILESTRKEVLRKRRNRPFSGNESMLCSALGRAYLAFCPDLERHTILARVASPLEASSSSYPEEEWMNSILAKVRDTGFALTEPGSCERHAHCKRHQHAMATPVRLSGRVRAALSLAWWDRDVIAKNITETLASPLLEAANDICEGLRELEY